MGVGEHSEVTPRRRRRRLLGALSWLTAIALAAGWAVYLRPASLGGPAGYVIVSGSSMEPMMHTGDLAVVRRQADYGIGEVVAYRIPKEDVGGGMLVIHRVIGGALDEGLVLQGDNRDTKDMWRPGAADVVGALWWHIPHAGTAMFLLRTPIVIAAVLAFFGFWAIVASPDRKREGVADDSAGDDPSEDLVPVAVPAGDSAGRSIPERGAHGTDAAVANAATVGVVALSVVAYFWARRADRP